METHLSATLGLAFSLAALGCGSGNGSGQGDLSASETQYVLQMREEEKLARDVYLGLDAKSATFGMIASAEQNHMDAVGTLVDKYGLEDPIGGKAQGEFASASMATLYADLVAKGDLSLVDALRVGAEIEDLDITDLDDALAASGQQDLDNVFSNLQRGSRNHLRAFAGELASQGASYEPQYLTMEEYNAIVESPVETGGP